MLRENFVGKCGILQGSVPYYCLCGEIESLIYDEKRT